MIRTGEFEIRAVDTGRFRLDGGAMFGVVPKALWEKTDPADERNRIEMHMRALYAEGEGRKILVDCGAGTKLDEKMTDIYDMKSRELRIALEEHGIDPLKITDAIATHLHFDHAGGYTFYNEAGELELSLPNATHHVQRKQWEAAIEPNDKDRASFFPENFLPIEEKGRLNLLEGSGEVLPGVRVVSTEGHTSGHQVVLFGEGEGTVMYCADLIPLASHVNLPWIMAYDHFPLSTLEEKRNLLTEAADGNWILFFEHDPSIAACRIEKNDRGRFDISTVVETG
jgi:glyoxylase-like metal-dependent hydrolase (beta-lactamase superfamily II)